MGRRNGKTPELSNLFPGAPGACPLRLGRGHTRGYWSTKIWLLAIDFVSAQRRPTQGKPLLEPSQRAFSRRHAEHRLPTPHSPSDRHTLPRISVNSMIWRQLFEIHQIARFQRAWHHPCVTLPSRVPWPNVQEEILPVPDSPVISTIQRTSPAGSAGSC